MVYSSLTHVQRNEQQIELIPLLEPKSSQGGHFTGGEVKAWAVITRQVSETGRTRTQS